MSVKPNDGGPAMGEVDTASLRKLARTLREDGYSRTARLIAAADELDRLRAERDTLRERVAWLEGAMKGAADLVAAEREACARVAEAEDVAPPDDPVGVQQCIAAAIRARSNNGGTKE